MSETAVERVDPRPRSVSKAFLGKIQNQDPERVYMLANPNEPSFGYDSCESDGWKPLCFGKDTRETVVGARKAADGTNRMMVQGNFVMWRPKSEQDAYLADKHGMQLRLSQQARDTTPERIEGNGQRQQQ